MIEIKELMLSVPDMTPQQGERLGVDVAERLFDTLPPKYENGNIEAMNIQLIAGQGLDHNQLVNDIASQIHYQLLNR